jgi:hypothetical protein
MRRFAINEQGFTEQAVNEARLSLKEQGAARRGRLEPAFNVVASG